MIQRVLSSGPYFGLEIYSLSEAGKYIDERGFNGLKAICR